jgi:hypothetical protein
MGEARRRRRAALLAGHPLKVEPKFRVRELRLPLPRALYLLLAQRWEAAAGEPARPDSVTVFAMERLLDGISLYDARRDQAEQNLNLVQLATPAQQARVALGKELEHVAP